MKKAKLSPSRKIKENMKSILEHTQYQKKKKAEYEITNAWPWHQLLGQHQKDYFGLPWRRGQLSVWHNSSVCPHAQCCCGAWDFMSIDVSFILSFIPSLSHLVSLPKHSSKISESLPSGKHHGQFRCSYLFMEHQTCRAKESLVCKKPNSNKNREKWLRNKNVSNWESMSKCGAERTWTWLGVCRRLSVVYSITQHRLGQEDIIGILGP